MKIEKRYAQFKGKIAIRDGLTGFVCGYDPNEASNSLMWLIMSVDSSQGWDFSSICSNPVIEPEFKGKSFYWVTSKDVIK